MIFSCHDLGERRYGVKASNRNCVNGKLAMSKADEHIRDEWTSSGVLLNYIPGSYATPYNALDYVACLNLMQIPYLTHPF